MAPHSAATLKLYHGEVYEGRSTFRNGGSYQMACVCAAVPVWNARSDGNRWKSLRQLATGLAVFLFLYIPLLMDNTPTCKPRLAAE